ncbi:MAG: hypothetical protein GYA55_10715, partial [SAR324 cluster bacterium]|nr:hypothetical protein [SAR324 cluster bacterium]
MSNFSLSQEEVLRVQVETFFNALLSSEQPREYVSKNGPKKPSDRAMLVSKVLEVTIEKADILPPKEVLRAIEIAEAIIESYGPRELAKRDELLNNL